MDKETNFQEAIVEVDSFYVDCVVRKYLFDNYGLDWGLAELARIRQEPLISGKFLFIYMLITSQEDFPIEWINNGAEEIILLRHDL